MYSLLHLNATYTLELTMKYILFLKIQYVIHEIMLSLVRIELQTYYTSGKNVVIPSIGLCDYRMMYSTISGSTPLIRMSYYFKTAEFGGVCLSRATPLN